MTITLFSTGAFEPFVQPRILTHYSWAAIYSLFNTWSSRILYPHIITINPNPVLNWESGTSEAVFAFFMTCARRGHNHCSFIRTASYRSAWLTKSSVICTSKRSSVRKWGSGVSVLPCLDNSICLIDCTRPKRLLKVNSPQWPGLKLPNSIEFSLIFGMFIVCKNEGSFNSAILDKIWDL